MSKPDSVRRIVCRFEKIKSFAVIAARSGHTMRGPGHDQLGHVDPARTALNETLIGTGDVEADVRARLTGLVGAVRKNGVIAVELVMTARAAWFDADPARIEAFKQRVLTESKRKYGQNLVAAVWHRDEAAPHFHLFVVPMNNKSKLDCRSAFGTIEAARRLQDWAGEVGQPLGLERGLSRAARIAEGDDEPVRHKTAAQYRAEAERDAAAAAADRTEAQRLIAEAAAERAVVAVEREAAATARGEAQTLLDRLKTARGVIVSWVRGFLLGLGQKQTDGLPGLELSTQCPKLWMTFLGHPLSREIAAELLPGLPDRRSLLEREQVEPGLTQAIRAFGDQVGSALDATTMRFTGPGSSEPRPT